MICTDSPKSQEEPDIDNLMKIVEESMSAYKACKSRVDAVQHDSKAFHSKYYAYLSLV